MSASGEATRDRAEGAIVVLVLMAAASILVAPVLGRAGVPLAAEAAMWLAAGCGVASFALAGLITLRAARQAGRSHGGDDAS